MRYGIRNAPVKVKMTIRKNGECIPKRVRKLCSFHEVIFIIYFFFTWNVKLKVYVKSNCKQEFNRPSKCLLGLNFSETSIFVEFR